MQMGPRMQAVLKSAAEDARSRGAPMLGTEHVLVALSAATQTVAGRVLGEWLSPDELNRCVQGMLGEMQRERFETALAPILDRCDEQVRVVVARAQDEARSLDDNHVGTEHLLLGTVAVAEDLPLGSLGLSRDSILDGLIDEPGYSPPVFVPWTPRAVRALTAAAEVAGSQVHVRHLVLGLAQEADEFDESNSPGPQHLKAALGRAGHTLTELRVALS